MNFCLFLALSAVTAVCNTEGGGTRRCVNNKNFKCTNCGTEPCVDNKKKCWSCAGNDNKCYSYDCGSHCSMLPCHNAQCSTTGCGKVPAGNDPRYTCTDCGCAPCVDIHNSCWSCAGSNNKCYPYHCGNYCSMRPCGSRFNGEMVPLKANYSVETHGFFAPPTETDFVKIPIFAKADKEPVLFKPASAGYDSVAAQKNIEGDAIETEQVEEKYT